MVHRPTHAALPAERLRALRHRTVACLLLALCAASFLGAGRRPLASTGAPRQSAPQGVVPDEALQDWPSQLPDAVGIFQCWPGAQRKTHESIVVWTDREDHVIALAPAREEDTLPAYAAALRDTDSARGNGAVLVADGRHRVAPAQDGPALSLGTVQLQCAVTSDD